MPEKNRNSFFCSLIIIFILGLTPLLWFHDGCIIKSEDVGIPLNFSEWQSYTYSWFNQRAAGTYPIDNFSALIFLFPPALLQKIGFSILSAQKIQFVFWFLMPGLGLYYLLLSLYKGKSPHFLVTLSSVGFYMFNLYLEPVWLGFNIANLSAYAFMPLLMGFFINGLRTKKFVKYISLCGLTAPLLSGIGANLPIAYVCLVIFFLWILYDFIFSVLLKREIKFRTYLKYSVLFSLVIVLVNAFWIYPQAVRYFKSAQLEPLQSYKQSVEKGYDGIIERSKYTSLLNILRLQGAWTWYESYEDDPYVLYSELYQNNWLFLLLSVIPAVLAFSAVFSLRSTKYSIFFILIALVGIIFSVGMHYTPPSYPMPPGYPEGCRPTFLALIYKFFLNAAPGFWVVRSPWYKWSILTTLGFAVMIGISVELVMKKIGKFFLVSRLVPVLIFAALLRYAFPIFTGEIFTTDAQRNYIPCNHIKIPAYVFDAADWTYNKRDFLRIMVLPSMERRITSWGYAGYEPVIGYFTDKPIIAPVTEDAFGSPHCIPNMNNFLYKWLYYDKNIENVKKLRELKSNRVAAKILPMFNIGYLLYEKDIRYDFYKNDPSKKIESEDFVHYKLSLQEGLTHEKSFGEWEFYLVENKLPHIYGVGDITLINGDIRAIEPLSRTDFFDYNLVFEDKLSPQDMDILRQRRLVETEIFYNSNEMPVQVFGKNSCFLLDTENKELFYKMEVMDKDISGNMVVSFVEGTFERESDYLTGQGVWMKDGSKPFEVKILNKEQKSTLANLKFSCRSIASQKFLHVYLNSRLIRVEKLEADKTKKIKLIGVEFVSGDNSLKFITSGEIGMTDSNIFFDGDFVFYTYEFNAKISLPEEALFYIYLYPYPVNDCSYLPVSKQVVVNGKKVEMRFNNDKIEYSALGALKLKGGWNSVKFLQEEREGYYFLLSNTLPSKNRQLMETQILDGSPVFYKVEFNNFEGENLLFILNEAFDEGWEAFYRTANGKYKKIPVHFLAGGYANGWYLDLTEGAQSIPAHHPFPFIAFRVRAGSEGTQGVGDEGAYNEIREPAACHRTKRRGPDNDQLVGSQKNSPTAHLASRREGYSPEANKADSEGKDRQNIVVVLKYVRQCDFVVGIWISALVLSACGIISGLRKVIR